MVNKEQIKAARAWLDMKQGDLAALAEVSHKTLANFERGATIPHDRTLRDIQITLENLGVEFIFEDHKGVGVKIRKPLQV